MILWDLGRACALPFLLFLVLFYHTKYAELDDKEVMIMKSIIFRCMKSMLAIILCLCVMACITAPAFAIEPSDEAVAAILNSMSQKHILTDEEFMAFNLEPGTLSVLDTSAFYDTIDSMDMSAFGQLSYEIPTAISSQNLLTMQYSSMQNDLKDLGFGESFELNVPEINLGYSNDIVSEFEKYYGDLSSKFTGSASLPAGFDMESLMATTQAKRDMYASDIKQTEAYQVVNENISANKAVTQAITTLETPELMSSISLQEMIDQEADGVKGIWDAKSDEGHRLIQDIYSANVEGRYNEDLQSLFEEAVGDTEAWLALAEPTNRGKSRAVLSPGETLFDVTE